MASSIHPTAIVAPSAVIGPDCEIGPFCVVGPHVKMGARNRMVGHATIEGWTTIGDDNTFFQGSVTGGVPQDLKYKGERTELILGNKNLIRECATLNLGTVQGGGKTQVGDSNLFMAYSHLGHDSTVKNHCIFANAVQIAGHVTFDDYSNVGGGVCVTQFLKLGRHSYIGAGSLVDRDIPPFVIAVGNRPLELKSTNLVGLRRAGYSAETIGVINEMIKLWRKVDVLKDDCLKEIESLYGEHAEVKMFIEFIRKSESGCLR